MTTPDLRSAHRAHIVEGCPWCAALASQPEPELLGLTTESGRTDTGKPGPAGGNPDPSRAAALAQPEPLDVERLARAMEAAIGGNQSDMETKSYEELAERFAAEYRRLSSDQAER